MQARYLTLPRLMNAAAMVALVAGATFIAPSSTAHARKAPPACPNLQPSPFDKKNFEDGQEIDNPYFPLEPGTTFTYKGFQDTPDQHVLSIVEVTHDTRTILGVKSVVVLDRVWINGKLSEKTFDWYAQDKSDNVWYMGEDATAYNEDGTVSHDGSWEGGKKGAKPGIIMEAHSQVGDTYRQEFAQGVAADTARVLSLNEHRTVPFGSFNNVLETSECTPLEPGAVEHKYFARGVGNIEAVDVSGGAGGVKLVSVTSDDGSDEGPSDGDTDD